MCGINGFNFSDNKLILNMKKFTANRGPDAEGIYIDEYITISHNRLSILDLSENANQPMSYKNLIISYNGEIYNFRSLREELESFGYKFNTSSDTEVILHLFDRFNTEAFKKLSGIFSICIWDKINKKLYLVRDTLGVKPLYYYFDNKNKKFFFSSSIRSILISLNSKEINFKALKYYKNFGRNDLSETIFKNIYKVMPGELITLSNNEMFKKKILNFDLKKKYISDDERKSLVENTIEKQLVSDVPLSLSLSGGVDSNVVYSVMRKKLEKKFNVYSFQFKDYEKFNQDFTVAKRNCNFYGDKFIPVDIGFEEFLNNCEKVTEILEEPSANQCSILNFCMSKTISEKILMTGDGGDESFSGYDRYRSIHIINFLQNINFLKKTNFKSKYKNINRLFIDNPKDMFLSFSEQNIYKNLNKYYLDFEKIDMKQLGLNHTANEDLVNNLNSVSLLDLDTIVPNEYLLRNDKIFMDSGIEVRVPLLDLDIINNVLNVSPFRKFGYRFKSKNMLKKIFKDDIHSLVKTKWGLQSPLAKWMKGPLQPFLYEILSKEYYDNSKNYFNFENIQNLIKLHKEKYFNPELLWSLVMLQIFLKRFNL